MKNKGFTIVELIIVIAVIGVLAAILIPLFANVIQNANAKSALSNAKNALTAQLTDDITAEEDVLIVTSRGGKSCMFTVIMLTQVRMS